MADSSYQIATTPKLYVSYPLFQYASGALDSYYLGDPDDFDLTDRDLINLIQLDPSNKTHIYSPSRRFTEIGYRLVPSYDDFTPMVDSGLMNIDYYMFLNHNFSSATGGVKISSIKTKDDDSATDYSISTSSSTHINDCYANTVPEYDGWSLIGSTGSASVNSSRTIEFTISRLYDEAVQGTQNLDCYLGSLLWGKSYQFPMNVQLNTSTKFEYGVSQKSTISGKTISTANWTKPNNWSTEPFGLTSDGEEGDNFQRRSGRRVWKMSFDSLAPDKVMPQNMMMNSNGYTAQDNHSTAADGTSLYNINNSEDFYSTVVHKTMGGHLPMVLQIDSNDNSPSNFAIVRMSSYTVTQKSPLLFSYSITLTEQI